MTIWGVITGALIGSFSAFLFNLILQVILRRIDRKKNNCEALLELLETVRDEAIFYWGAKYGEDLSLKLLSEAKIKVFVRSQQQLINKFKDNFSNKIPTSEQIKLDQFLVESFDLVTGDSFEGKPSIDLKRCKSISLLYTKTIITINSYKNTL